MPAFLSLRSDYPGLGQGLPRSRPPRLSARDGGQATRNDISINAFALVDMAFHFCSKAKEKALRKCEESFSHSGLTSAQVVFQCAHYRITHLTSQFNRCLGIFWGRVWEIPGITNFYPIRTQGDDIAKRLR